MKIVGVGIVCILLLISGCDMFFPRPQGGSGGRGRSSVRGPVLARVGKWTLTADEFNREISEIIKANDDKSEIKAENLGLLARTFIPSNVTTVDFSTSDGKKIYLDVLINLELLAQEAESRGLNNDPEIARKLRRSTVEILDFALLNDVLRRVTVTPLEVEEFYNNEYRKTLERIERRRVREIVVGSESGARDLLIEYLRGEDFANLAYSNSIAESKSKGGDLGYIVYQPGEKFEKFWEIVLALEEGQVSSIFKHPAKREYYLVKVEDIKKGEVESLSRVYDELETILKQRKSVQAIEGLLEKVKARTSVEINTSFIE